MEDYLVKIGERVDRIISTDVTGRGVIGALYEAARKRAGQPLASAAAAKLAQIVPKKSVVYILTGFQAPNWTNSESDGPVGAVALARAISIGLEALPVIVTDDINVNMTTATCYAAAVNVFKDKVPQDYPARSVAIIGVPVRENMEQRAKSLLDNHKPAAVVSIERPGWNEKHVYHTSSGKDISNINAHLDHVFEEAQRRKIPTIGIGDGGNEIGMGSIIETVKQVVPTGAKCKCPCGAGVAAASKADVLVAALVSNWGGYGIAACLAGLLKNPAVFHDRRIELRMIEAAAGSGAVDGVVGYPERAVDGMSDEVNASIVEILSEIVKKGLAAVQVY